MPDGLQSTSSNESASDNQSNNIDTALDNLETMKTRSDMSDVQIIKASTSSMQDKMSCQFDKLDAMINKAENAQHSMAHQNNQMKSFLKWTNNQTKVQISLQN